MLKKHVEFCVSTLSTSSTTVSGNTCWLRILYFTGISVHYIAVRGKLELV
jgi:hypothetical protein